MTDGAVGLAHRRLAVIDLSDLGRQPLEYGGDLWITYNGEVYNFPPSARNWRRSAIASARTRTPKSSWRRTGSGAPAACRASTACSRLRSGMRATRTLFAARDRAGKKPLYYRIDRDGLAFASEPKAFLAEPGFTVRPDPHALFSYLSRLCVPAPQSAFAGVTRLAPGHCLTATSAGVTVERYWRLRTAPSARSARPTPPTSCSPA